jgi:osmoprotectant transport system permease protein
MDRPNPWLSWAYVQDNWSDIAFRLEQHTTLTVEAIAIAFAIALPLAAVAHFAPRLAGAIVGTSAVFYTVPSLALFGILAPYTGIGRATVLIGLVAYALLALVRNILVGLQAVDPDVVDAGRGLGYGRIRLLWLVELPNALPSVIAGLRVATVTTVALTTVGVVVGFGGLGQIMFRGFYRGYNAEVATAGLLCVLLALTLDLLLLVLGKVMTPWLRGARS